MIRVKQIRHSLKCTGEAGSEVRISAVTRKNCRTL